MAKTTIEVLDDLNLLSWNVLACGRNRGWVTAGDLSRFAVSCLDSANIDDVVPAVAELASAEKLSTAEIDKCLARLSSKSFCQEGPELDAWRLAKLLQVQSQDLRWDEKVTRLEEVASEFSYPADMQGCSRYSSGTSDPLDEMNSVISSLKKQLGVE